MMGPEWARSALEIASDFAAFASAGAVIVPVYRTLVVRERLSKLAARIRGLPAGQRDLLTDILRDQTLRLAEFTRFEKWCLNMGIVLLAFACICRIVFHVMMKLGAEPTVHSAFSLAPLAIG